MGFALKDLTVLGCWCSDVGMCCFDSLVFVVWCCWMLALWAVVGCIVARQALVVVVFVVSCFPWRIVLVDAFDPTLLCPACIHLHFSALPCSCSRRGRAFSFDFLVSFRTVASTAAAPAFAGAAAGRFLSVFFPLLLLFLWVGHS